MPSRRGAHRARAGHRGVRHGRSVECSVAGDLYANSVRAMTFSSRIGFTPSKIGSTVASTT